MGEKLSAERLEGYLFCIISGGCTTCPIAPKGGTPGDDCELYYKSDSEIADDLLSHIAAQDEEIAQLRAVHESELGVCEQHCEVVKRLRELLREWTDMDPLRYDSEYSACPWCDFSYSKMQHERDCAFVLARAECGVDAAVEGRD